MIEPNSGEQVQAELFEMTGVTPPPAEPPTPAAPVTSQEPAPVAPVEPPTPTPTVPEPPAVEPPAAPVAPTPSVEPLAPAAPPVEPPAPQLSETDQLKATIESLRQEISRLAVGVTTPQPAPTPAPPQVDANGQPIPVAPQVHQFLATEEEVDAALNSKDNLNALLTKVSSNASESVMRQVQQEIGPVVQQLVSQYMLAHEFFAANQDLSPHRAYVGMVANELAAQNPGIGMPGIIEKLAGEVRKRLAYGTVPGAPSTPQTPVAPQTPVETPAFVPGAGARPTGGQPNPGDAVTNAILELADL